MQGHFDLTLLDAGGYTDADFKRAQENGTILKMLDSLDIEQKCSGSNQVFDHFAETMFIHLMSGPGVSFPYGNGGTGSAYLGSLVLSTYDTEPTYTETETYGFFGRTVHSVGSSANTSSAGKRFIEDDIIDPDIIVDPDGRESIIVRSKFLYLTTEGTSNNIRSLAIWYDTDADLDPGSSGREWGIGARIRLKDSGGNPTIINKTSSQVLLVEYTFTLVSI